MAAPLEKTIKDLQGKWTINKTLSDDIDPMMQLQNLSWFIRKAINYATITLHITTYTDAESKPHIDISQIVTGGIQTTTEKRVLDWTWRDHKDNIFGSLKGRSRFCKLSDIEDDEWIRTGWEDAEGEFLQSFVESYDDGWTANQVWGFEIVNKERRYVRHIIVRKAEEKVQARLVYDYIGKFAPEGKEEDGLAYEG